MSSQDVSNHSESFGKSLRLLTSSDFQAVFDDAPFRASHKHFLILARPHRSGNSALPRLGLVIAKKNIRLAVQRNRMKRLIRESFRQQQHSLADIEAVVIARRGMDDLDNLQLLKQLRQQWQRIAKKARKHRDANATAASDQSQSTPCAG